MNCPKIRIRSASIKCQEWKILPLSQIRPCMKSEICSKCYLGHKSQPTNGGENHQNMQESAHKKNRQGLKMEECKQKSPKHAKNCLPQNSPKSRKICPWRKFAHLERRKWFVKMKWGGDSLYSQFLSLHKAGRPV